MSKKSGLGRGLDALFYDNADNESSTLIDINDIEPNSEQPRRHFDEDALQSLSDSIRQHGLLQPIIVRPTPAGTYQIVAGERRWRASRRAELSKVPVIIKDLSDNETAELALIENLQREDLNPIEEAGGYRKLMDEFSLTQEEVSERVGKSRSAVANSLRLLQLPEDTKRLVIENVISAGHARALLSVADSSRRDEALALAKKGASVRELEKFVQSAPAAKKPVVPAMKNTYTTEVEQSLYSELGRRVRITGNGSRGTLTIEYLSKEDLADIANQLAGIAAKRGTNTW